MKRSLFMALCCACSSQPFAADGTSSPPDAGAPVTHDAGAVWLPEINVPWVAPSQVAAGGSPSEPAGSDARAPSEGGAPSIPEADAGAPKPPDAGAPGPELPAGWLQHKAHLEGGGYACPALEQAVTDCCASPAAAFTCDADGCKCGAVGYGSMGSLCSIAPATPLQWVCP